MLTITRLFAPLGGAANAKRSILALLTLRQPAFLLGTRISVGKPWPGRAEVHLARCSRLGVWVEIACESGTGSGFWSPTSGGDDGLEALDVWKPESK